MAGGVPVLSGKRVRLSRALASVCIVDNGWVFSDIPRSIVVTFCIEE